MAAIHQLRPMNNGDILDTTFKLYRENFATYWLILLAVQVPASVIQLVMTRAMWAADGAQAEAAGLVMIGLLAGLVSFLAMILASGALAIAIARNFLGQSISAGSAYKAILPRLVTLIVASILSGLVIGLGFVLLIVPGIIFMVWLMLVTPVVVLEKSGSVSSLGRSRELIKDHFRQGLLLLVIVGIIGFAGGFLSGSIGGALSQVNILLGSLLEAAIDAAVLPIVTAPAILFYYNLRVRKEAFDLEQLAAQFETTVPDTLADQDAASPVRDQVGMAEESSQRNV